MPIFDTVRAAKDDGAVDAFDMLKQNRDEVDALFPRYDDVEKEDASAVDANSAAPVGDDSGVGS